MIVGNPSIDNPSIIAAIYFFLLGTQVDQIWFDRWLLRITITWFFLSLFLYSLYANDSAINAAASLIPARLLQAVLLYGAFKLINKLHATMGPQFAFYVILMIISIGFASTDCLWFNCSYPF